jgi:hypothetical protein
VTEKQQQWLRIRRREIVSRFYFRFQVAVLRIFKLFIKTLFYEKSTVIHKVYYTANPLKIVKNRFLRRN